MRHVLADALAAAERRLRGSGTDEPVDPIDAATDAVRVLEQSTLTNAGGNSTAPTLSGDIECDAAIVTDTPGVVGAVGAIPNVAVCSDLARYIVKLRQRHQDKGFRYDDNRVIPSVMCGPSALAMFPPDILCRTTPSVSAQSLYHTYRPHIISDTVGCVVLTRDKGACVATASAGPLLRASGRVGPAGIPGAAAWCCRGRGVAMSGDGEWLISDQSAREVATHCATVADMQAVVAGCGHGRRCGLISAEWDSLRRKGAFSVMCCFNTEAMAWGWVCSASTQAVVNVSRSGTRSGDVVTLRTEWNL